MTVKAFCPARSLPCLRSKTILGFYSCPPEFKQRETIYSQTLWQIVVLVSCFSPSLLCTSDVQSGCYYELYGFPFVVCCSTAESSCRGDCCAVVRAAHKCSASLWQPVAHFTLTASVFTVINQWWPGGCHFAPCGARLRLGSAPQTHSRPCWGNMATHAHTHVRAHTYRHAHTHWIGTHTHTQKKTICSA